MSMAGPVSVSVSVAVLVVVSVPVPMLKPLLLRDQTIYYNSSQINLLAVLLLSTYFSLAEGDNIEIRNISKVTK
jgi:hypothetical protein